MNNSKYLYSVKQTMTSRSLVSHKNKRLFDSMMRESALTHAAGHFKKAGTILKQARRLVGVR